VCQVSPKVTNEFSEFKSRSGARLWVFYFGGYERSLADLADAEHLVVLDDAGQAALEALAREVD
jgi:hypothetical protein